MERHDGWALVRSSDGSTTWVEASGLEPLTKGRPNPWVALLIVIVLIALLAGGAYLFIRARITQGEPSNPFTSGLIQLPWSSPNS